MPRMTALTGLLGLTLLLSSAAAQAPASTASLAVPLASAECAAPADILTSDEKLPEVAQALKSGHRLDVLAVGSATMLGPRGATDESFPYRMAHFLRAAVPGADINVTVHGGRGLTAADMLGTMRKELASHRYDLVLWQTGHSRGGA